MGNNRQFRIIGCEVYKNKALEAGRGQDMKDLGCHAKGEAHNNVHTQLLKIVRSR